MRKRAIPRAFLATVWPSMNLALGVTGCAAQAGWYLDLTSLTSKATNLP